MLDQELKSNRSYSFLAGGGEMGTLIRSIDWSETPIGTVGAWPVPLKIATGIILSTPFPMYIAWGKEYIQLYNDGYRPILGSTKHPQAMGISTKETFAEIWHIIGPMFDNVMKGKAIGFPNFMLPLNRNGYVEECFFDFSYSPISDEEGNIGGVLVTVIETTKKVKNNALLTQSADEQYELNEQLTAANQELLQAQQELQKETVNKQEAIERLKANEENLRNMVRQAPVGMCIVGGDPLYAVEVNDSFLELIGKSREDLKLMPYWEVNAEAAAYYKPITDQVLATGITYHANEHEVMLVRKGKEEVVHVDFVYEPMKDGSGKTYAIMIVAIDVTEKVLARKELETAYEQIRLSKQAAKLGTFDMDLINGTMEWDERCRTLFGISHQETVSYEKDFLPGLHPDDLERVKKVIRDVFIKSVSNGDYDVEYRTLGVDDHQLRWVRAKGKAYFDEEDKPYRFIGSVLDITEIKRDEIRKNDFIGMVSHELKTPLTSLTAIIQVLNTKLKNSEDQFVAGASEKANLQVKKMANMINGFLNISRLEAGKIIIDKRTFDLIALIKEVIEEILITSPSHHITLMPCSATSISADRDKIGSVISNLLTNAIKYSPKGKSIELTCEVLESTVLVSVKDEGMGIKPPELERLFDRFYRVESKHTAHISGFGIGLYLSAEIIQRHHGKIWAESQSGVGSVFYFSLPLR